MIPRHRKSTQGPLKEQVALTSKKVLSKGKFPFTTYQNSSSILKHLSPENTAYTDSAYTFSVTNFKSYMTLDLLSLKGV